MKQKNRAFSMLTVFVITAITIIIISVFSPQKVNATESLSIDNIEIGDHIYMGREGVEGYKGIPYWRVLDVNSKNETALLVSEYLWMGNGSDSDAYVLFESEENNFSWEGSNAQQWCQNFDNDIMNTSPLIAKKSMTDEAYTYYVDYSPGNYGSNTIDDRIFFLSAEEVGRYMPFPEDRIASTYDPSDMENLKIWGWWIRSPRIFDGNTYGGKIDNEGWFNWNYGTGNGARPAFCLSLKNPITAMKNDSGDWIISDEMQYEGSSDSITGDEDEIRLVASGTINDNQLFRLFNDGLFVVSGSGAMADYMSNPYYPWDSYLDSIKEISIEEGITEIGAGSFRSCTNLERINFPKSIINIGGYAFSGCTSLRNVSLPQGIITIGDDCFERCEKLESINIPGSVKSIGKEAFDQCKSLSEISIPDSVNSIGEYCFSWSALKMIRLPNGLTQLSPGLFHFCRQLESISIPSGVTEIGSSCFEGCTSLTEVDIPSNVTQIGERAFYSCYYLENISFPVALRTIGDEAFFFCNKLSSIELPNSVEAIGKSAFSCCDSITSFSIPTRVTTISDYMLNGCTQLTTVRMHDGITEIREGAFSSCSFQEILIPDSVIQIGESAFKNCDELSSIKIPSQVKTLSKSIFYDCDSLNSVILPSGLTTIGNSAFDSCNSLESISLPPGLKTIGNCAFRQCSQLNDISIPDEVTRIGACAFYFCENLPYFMVLPKGITKIEEETFYGCSNLSQIYIAGISIIDKGAFDSCNLSRVYYLGSEEDWNSIVIGDNNYNLTHCEKEFISTSCGDNLKWDLEKGILYIHGSGEMYKYGYSVDAPWSIVSGHISQIVIEADNITIYSNAFSSCSSLKEIHLPEDISAISCECIGRENAEEIDCYYAGDARQWAVLTSFGPNAAAPLKLVKMHYGTPLTSYHQTIYGDNTNIHLTSEKFLGGLYRKENQLTEVSFNWGFNQLKNDSREPNINLAIASLIFAANIYDFDLYRETVQKLGFRRIIFENEDGYDDINRVAYSMSSSVQRIGGQLTNVILISCRGSAEGDDWKSNILQQAQGFRYAAEDVKKGLIRYISTQNIDRSLPTKILITGHSRGAAVANILGTIVSGITNDSNVFVYTYACPNTTTESNRRDYLNIYNILVNGDPVPGIPFMWGGSNKFGKIITVSADPNAQSFITVFHSITGGVSTVAIDSISAECVSSYDFLGLPLARHHAPAVYLACLLESSGSAIGDDLSLLIDASKPYKVKCISVKCPVDVEIYDGDNNLLGTITNNIPSDSLIQCGIQAVVEGDEKHLYTGLQCELKVVLTGTDEGKMDYAVQEMDIESSKILSNIEFSSVALENGKVMINEIGGATSIEESKLYIIDENWNVVEEIPADEPENASSQSSANEHINDKEGNPKADHQHVYGKWITSKAATELASGIRTRKCSICGTSETQTIGKLKPSLKTVTIIKPRLANKSVIIKWKKISKKNLKKIKKIQIQYSTDKNFKNGVKTKYANAKKPSYKIKSLKKGKKYYVRIRAYTKTGGNVHVSKWSKKKLVKVK